MKNVKVLGTGCANCKNTVKLVAEVALAKGVEIQLEKVEEIQDIATYRIMATPGVVIDGQVVHAGGVPSREKVESWFVDNVASWTPHRP
jgi:small redox-active disulfide protein 2